MICPHCTEEGRKSRVYQGSTRHAGDHCPPHRDMDGRLHHHDTNKRVTRYRCSNGHTFEITGKRRRCWCGWPGEEE